MFLLTISAFQILSYVTRGVNKASTRIDSKIYYFDQSFSQAKLDSIRCISIISCYTQWLSIFIDFLCDFFPIYEPITVLTPLLQNELT